MLIQCIPLLLVLLVIVVVKRKLQKFIDLHNQIGTDFPYVPVIGHAYKFYGSNEGKLFSRSLQIYVYILNLLKRIDMGHNANSVVQNIYLFYLIGKKIIKRIVLF